MRSITWILVFWSLAAACQKSIPLEKPVCQDAKFEKTVDDLLNYTVPVISVDSLYSNLDKFTILDAREWEEYKTSHIPQSIYVGYKGFSDKQLRGIGKEEKIVVYCSVGYRSEKIGEKLKAMGFQNVQNLYGSIFEWVNKDYPIVNLSGDPTQNLHTYNKSWGKHVSSKQINKVN